MDRNSRTQQNENDFTLRNARGVGNVTLVIFLSIWVIAFSGLNLFLRWSIEQTMFETDTGIADGRWLVQLGLSLIIFIPLLAIYFGVKVPRIKLMLGLWLIAGLFSLLTVPIKFLYLTAQNQTSVLSTLSLMLMIITLMLLKRRQNKSRLSLPMSRLTGTAVLAGVGLATPWVLWGALGSVLDTILVILLGITFSIFVVFSVFPFYFEKTQPSGHSVGRGEYLFDGFVLAIFLLISVTGLSQNGSQILLVLTAPASGWLIAAFAAAGRNRRDHGRLAAGIISALTLILPLAFFDMDELALIVSGTTSNEVLFWSQRAAWYTFIFLVAISLVILIVFHWHEKANVEKRINLGLIVLSIFEFFVLYIFAGQPGFFGDRLFVIMKEQVNVSEVGSGLAFPERRSALYEEMTTLADNSQHVLREKLKKQGISFTPYYLVNSIEVNAGWFRKQSLAKIEGVDRVLESPRLRPLPRSVSPPQLSGEVSVPPSGTLWNLEMTGVTRVHLDLGITGKGILVGQTDSGVDVTHPELAQSYRGKNGSNDYNWLDPWNGTVSPVDYGGHGTGTLGIIVGVSRGIAPDSEWIGCVNLARNLGNPALYLDCMQFMYAPYPQGGDPFQHGDPLRGAMIINNSWGCPRVEGCDAGVFEQAVEVFKSAGVFMSVAAGNNGYYGCSTISDPPSIYGDVFTVGAVDLSGQLSAFSSRGPVIIDGSNREKPDILAPGEQLLVSALGGAYTFSSGTSFAAPHVSGVVALMWSANPDLIGDIDTTIRILKDTAQPYDGVVADCGGEVFEAGAGIIDAFAAVEAAMNLANPEK